MFGRDRGDRGALVAIGMMLATVLVVFFGSLSETSISVVTTTDKQKAASNQAENVLPSAAAFEPWHDSYAQWLMAFFSVLATGVSFWAVRLVRHSLQVTRDAVEEARNANQIAREIGQDQSRAYVFIDAADLYFLDETAPRIQVMLLVKNSGDTPAKWFNVRSAVDVCDAQLPPEAPPFEGYRWNALGGGDTLTVQAKNDENTTHFNFDCLDSISCRGVVEYETFFGEVFFSEFAFIAHPKFRIKFERKEVSADSTAYVRMSSRGKEIPTKMSRVAGSLKTFHKKA